MSEEAEIERNTLRDQLAEANEETIEQSAKAAAKNKRQYRVCPCGKIPEKLILEVGKESKVGRAAGDCCGTWGIEFLRGYATEPEDILDKAHAAWDAAPR